MSVTKPRRITTAIVILLGVFLFISWVSWSYHRYYRFRQHEIHSLIKSSDDWWGKSVEFILVDRHAFYVPKPSDSKFKVGDSISKSINSTVLDIYRKNSAGDFKFIFSYNAYK